MTICGFDLISTTAELVRRYLNGKSLEALTQEYPHLSYRKVRTLLLGAGVTLRPPRVPLPPAPPGLLPSRPLPRQDSSAKIASNGNSL